MSDIPQEIDILITQMARLPGLGPRSARRAVLQLIKKKEVLLLPLAQALEKVVHTVQECKNCRNIATCSLCPICQAPNRKNGTLCVVESVADLWAIERSAYFKGRYHVLGGTLSALDQIGPEQLGILQLHERLKDENITEIILALNATVSGQTTAHYIAEELQGDGIKITSLAQGIPIGGELDYLDDGTIATAMRARKNF